MVLVLALACRAAVATGDEDEWPIFAKVRAHSGDGQRGISSHWLETGLFFFSGMCFYFFGNLKKKAEDLLLDHALARAPCRCMHPGMPPAPSLSLRHPRVHHALSPCQLRLPGVAGLLERDV